MLSLHPLKELLPLMRHYLNQLTPLKVLMLRHNKPIPKSPQYTIAKKKLSTFLLKQIVSQSSFQLSSVKK
jgi:hypothetical protein